MKKIICVILSLALSTLIFAQDLSQQVKEACMPYVQNVTGTGFTVVWTTNMDAVSWVEVAPDDGTDFQNVERQKYYDLSGLGRRPVTKLHRVTVSGLKPDTKYRYRVMMEGVIQENNRKGIIYTAGYGLDVAKYPTYVRTLAQSYDKLKIAVVNDVHENDSVFRRLFKDSKDKYDFVVFNGDMTSTIDNEKDLVANYLNSAASLFACSTPFYMVRGNHEYRGNDALKFKDYFATPTGKTYYTFSYGKYFFLVLDGGEDKCDSDIRNLGVMITEQYVKEESEWLKTVIASEDFKKAETRIAFCHMPPEPKGWHGNVMVDKYLVPTLNEGGIDLMLCAHIHAYRYDKVGTTDAKFPIVCNPNRQLMTVDVDGKSISLNIVNPDGKLTHSIKF
ncbi:MAG: FN3 domain-containing metallophosphoesterase family protein [Bacteroidales bacterium]